MQTNDAKQYWHNPNCFEKTKVRWGIFKKLSPTKLHSEQSATLAANVSGLCVVALSRNLKLTTTLDRAITQNPCYVPLNYQSDDRI